MSCVCGHVRDEHDEGAFFKPCTVCGCSDYETAHLTPLPQPHKPCGECPFRRAAAPGWIGGHEQPSEITDIVMADQKFPCHTAVNALLDEGAEFDQAKEAAPYCVGAVIMMNNTCKLSHHKSVVELQRRLGKSADVFKNANEFVQHHAAVGRVDRKRRKGTKA